ncbi:MAG TPA: 5-(carboxyamino)imidazole ribonucleotide synthase, partial [Methylophilaceae bacterium]|nr:5-(carboxyamino)imidazole ribonucleotide synthase [Methylophilaceae bacterium]
CSAYDDQAALDRMARECVAVTTEFENVPASTLSALAQSVPVHPAASAVAICQHRISEKNFLRDNGFPHAPYAEINEEIDIPMDDAGLYPGILKVARFGYDGKGQARVRNREEALLAFRNFKGEQCVLENMLALDYEVSVVLARDASGNVKAFPVAENIHRNGVLDISIVPARGSAAVREQAQALARGVAVKLNYVGTLGVEFFVCNGSLYINEMAPRPHNSGHYTIDACVTNQFEQQIRALCGLPLGDPRLHSPAVMVNLLGDIWRDGEPEWGVLFEQLDLKLHLYGKHEARAGRKMGHFTVIGDIADDVIADAMSARQRIKVEG